MYHEQQSVKIAGLLVPLLLFTEDIVLVGRVSALMWHLLVALSGFCARSGLTINLDKTVWLAGGEVSRDVVLPSFCYRGSSLQCVQHFCFLGLDFSGHGLVAMVEARVRAA